MPDLALITEHSAAALRAPMLGEIFPIDVTTGSKRFVVPAPWKGAFVRIQADGGDLYLQVSTRDDAIADKDARAQEAGTETIELTPSASGNDAFKISDGQWLDVPFPGNAQTFALQGSAECCARCHLSEG